MRRAASVILVFAGLGWSLGHLVLPAGPPAWVYPVVLAANAAFALAMVAGCGMSPAPILVGLLFLALPPSAPLALCHLVAASLRRRARGADVVDGQADDLRQLAGRWLSLGNVASAMAVVWIYLVVVPLIDRGVASFGRVAAERGESPPAADLLLGTLVEAYRDPLRQRGSNEGLFFAALAALATVRLARELWLSSRVVPRSPEGR